jgi:hypothetical protein
MKVNRNFNPKILSLKKREKKVFNSNSAPDTKQVTKSNHYESLGFSKDSKEYNEMQKFLATIDW